MKPSTVELVFVLDASESMRPCFEGLANNLQQVVNPLQTLGLKVRLGFIAMRVGNATGGGGVIATASINSASDPIALIASGDPGLFTEDNALFSSKMRALELGGDEHQLLALDCALDFPFGPMVNTRRVVAMFSDETIEDGFLGAAVVEKIPAIVTKIMARRIQFFAALPSSPALEALGSADCAQIEPVQGGEGLANVNFSKLLGQMAKSISCASLQAGPENYQKGLFGQYELGSAEGDFTGLR